MVPEIFKQRSYYSEVRMKELRTRLATLKELSEFPNLTVFGAGSYGRLEASEFSDLDVFFLYSGDEKDLDKSPAHANIAYSERSFRPSRA